MVQAYRLSTYDIDNIGFGNRVIRSAFLRLCEPNGNENKKNAATMAKLYPPGERKLSSI